MPITYPRNTEAKYVLYRISTSEVLNANTTYPRADGGEVEGLDPDLIYLERVNGLVPDYDPRYFVRVTTETPDLEGGYWNIVHTTQKRDVADIEQTVENIEAQSNENLLPYTKQLKTLLLGVAVCLRQLEAQALTNKETAIKDRVMNLALKVWQNDDTLKQKLSLIQQGSEPDLDAEWVRE